MRESKNYKGFLKMERRQNSKPTIKKVVIKGLFTYCSEEGKYVPLEAEHFNNHWNGMNLKVLCRRENNMLKSYTGMYAKININKDGKHILSRHGKSILKNKINKNDK